MPTFTVFTPTFNRASLLHRVYDSLKAQTFRDFEWVVVDDGSTDGTREVIAGWLAESDFPIRYFWQPNAHKKTAFNRGVREALGPLFLPWDSDDTAVPEALEMFWTEWQAIDEGSRPAFAGVTALCADEHGAIVGSRFPQDRFDSDPLESVYRYRIQGEKWGFIRTELLRQFPFPEDIPGHVPEGVVWGAIARRYKTRYVNRVVRTYHQEQDSITQTGASGAGAARNAEGHALWARAVLENELGWFFRNPAWFLRMAANHTRFSSHSIHRSPPRRFPVQGFLQRLLLAAMWPVGKLLYLRDLSQVGH